VDFQDVTENTFPNGKGFLYNRHVRNRDLKLAVATGVIIQEALNTKRDACIP
jgi:hypothetical protein